MGDWKTGQMVGDVRAMSNAPHERAAEGGPLDAVVVRQTDSEKKE